MWYQQNLMVCQSCIVLKMEKNDLYSRGGSTNGFDLSHMIPYLQLPDLRISLFAGSLLFPLRYLIKNIKEKAIKVPETLSVVWWIQKVEKLVSGKIWIWWHMKLLNPIKTKCSNALVRKEWCYYSKKWHNKKFPMNHYQKFW